MTSASAEFVLPLKPTDFAAGLVYGLTGDEHYRQISDCFTATDPMKSDLTEAINSFRHFDFISGIKFVGDIMVQLPEAFQKCKGLEVDIHAIEDWATIFREPLRLMKTVSMNYLEHAADVQDEVAHGREDWVSGDWYQCGKDIADIMTTLVGPVIMPEPVHAHMMHANGSISPETIAVAVAGLVYGLTGDNNLDEMQKCFKSTGPMIEDLQKALEEFKTFNIIGGINEIGQMILQLPYAFKDCASMKEDMHAIEDWATIFSDPLRLMKTVSMNYLEHGIEIQHDIA